MRRSWWLAVVIGLVVAAFAGCRGERKRFGAQCGGDDECVSGLCVTGAGGNHPFCTKSCATSSECPRHYSCAGATTQGVVVCIRGGATPFGQ